MEDKPLEEVVRNIDERLGRVEQFLPTLATKEELGQAITTLATKLELRDAIAGAVAPLATKAELHDAIAAAIAPLATKIELRETIAEAVAPLATKIELREAIAEEGERMRRHFDMVAERIEGHVRLIADGHMSLSERIEDLRTEVKGDIAQHDCRITRLEARRKP